MEYNINEFVDKAINKVKKENNIENYESDSIFSQDGYIELSQNQLKINLTPNDTIYFSIDNKTGTANKLTLMYNKNQGLIGATINKNGKINERYIIREELFYIIDKLIKFEENLCIIKNNDNIKSIKNYRKKPKRQ